MYPNSTFLRSSEIASKWTLGIIVLFVKCWVKILGRSDENRMHANGWRPKYAQQMLNGNMRRRNSTYGNYAILTYRRLTTYT